MSWRGPLLTEAARPRLVAQSPLAPWLAVATVCLGAFLGQLDASIVTITFPALGAEFGTAPGATQWVSLGYLLTLIALLVPVGRWADRIGRKQCYLYGFAAFVIGSAACAASGSLAALVACRVVQATGAALLQANSVALVTTSVAAPRRRAALGVQAAAQALGLALGPLAGATIIADLGWRWVFWSTVPVGFVGLVAGYFLLPRTTTRDDSARIQVLGPMVLTVGSSSILIGLSVPHGLALPRGSAAPLMLCGIATLAGFLWWQRRRPDGLIPAVILRQRTVRSGLFAAVLGYMVLFGPLVAVPAMMARRGFTPMTVGAMTTALPAGLALSATLAGTVLPRSWSNRHRASAGGACCVIVTCAAAMTSQNVLIDEPIVLVGLLAILGIGLGVFTPANNAMLMSAIPISTAALGGGLVNMARALGTALGVASVTYSTSYGAGAVWITLAVGSLLLTVSAARG